MRAGVQCDAEGRPHGEHRRGVDDRGAQQLVGHGVRRSLPGGIREVEAGALEQHVAGQRVAVGAQSGRGQSHDGIARPDPLGAELGAVLHCAHGEAGQVELVGRHDPRMLGRLAADQRAARLPAALVHPGHHGRDVLGVDLARGEVVEHEEGLGADADQVVHAHGDQVDADRLVTAGGASHHQLRAHPVGRGHQHGPGEAVHVEGELAPEAADARHERAQAVDGGVPGGDVHPGAGVGGAALAHGVQTPGSAAWWAVTATGSGRPSETGVAWGTGVG